MDDERYLLRAIDLAARARSKGNEPFGALIVDPDGNVLVEAENTVVTARDCSSRSQSLLKPVRH
jgi:tRNA(Arg) A34 adenosine deaminase TadA